jgi:hypothetical protein
MVVQGLIVGGATDSHQKPGGQRPLPVAGIATVVHALLISAVWSLEFFGNVALISPRVWAGAAWLWLLWPPILCFQSSASTKMKIVPIAVGVLLLLPCLSTVISFTEWTLFGFSP